MKTFALVAVTLGLLSIPAVAETQEEQQACMNDAFRVCGSAIPDRDRVTACMVKNRSQLGAPCRAVMTRYSKPGVTNATQSARRTTRAENTRAEAY